jgi:deoxyadenosine/deoxycytidine kinase
MRITVEANIGAGKTTLINRLKDALGDDISVFLEPVEEWGDWLRLFYTDPLRWGFTFNLNALMSFMRVPDGRGEAGEAEIGSAAVIVERSPLSCFQVFTTLQHKHGHMTTPEFDLFKKVYAQVAWTPDVILYLKTDPHRCQERMRRRDRDSERGVGLEYLQDLHNQHEVLMLRAAAAPDALFGDKAVRIITLDANADADAVFEEALQQIQDLIRRRP